MYLLNFSRLVIEKGTYREIMIERNNSGLVLALLALERSFWSYKRMRVLVVFFILIVLNSLKSSIFVLILDIQDIYRLSLSLCL